MKLLLLLVIYLSLILATSAANSWAYFNIYGYNKQCGVGGTNFDVNETCKRACGGNILIKNAKDVTDGYVLYTYPDSDTTCSLTPSTQTQFVCKTANEPVVVIAGSYNVTCYQLGTQPPGSASTVSLSFGLIFSILLSILFFK